MHQHQPYLQYVIWNQLNIQKNILATRTPGHAHKKLERHMENVTTRHCKMFIKITGDIIFEKAICSCM
jgi:hypothetical protein